MESIQHIRKTDLARNTREVLNSVMRGQTAVIESHGKAEAAIIDIVDYLILRAVMRYHARPPVVDADAGLSDAAAAATPASRRVTILSWRTIWPMRSA